MKHSYFAKSFTALTAIMLFYALHASAQLDSCNVFLKGNYIEVGINWNGAYGSSIAAPSGYHPKGPSGEKNAAACGAACYSGGNNLGFVADPDKDGWTVGSPYPYYGDYFLPGTPQEGWAIQADTSEGWAYNGGGCGTIVTTNLNGSNLSYTSSGKKRTGIWQGSFDSMAITQVTTLDTNNVFFTVYITLINKGHLTRHNAYYLRTLDPDNAEPETFNFSTDNKIEYQLPNPQNRTLVSAVGETSSGADIPAAFLGLGTLDCRAKCFIHKTTGLYPSYGTAYLTPTLDSMYGGFGGKGDTVDYIYGSGNTYKNDVGVSLVFKLGDILPGDSVNFAYAYILRKGDLDSAFLSTLPKWTTFGDTAAYRTGDTTAVCKNSIIPVSIVNGGYLNWSWSSPTGNSFYPSTGTNINVAIDSTPAILRAIGTSPSCNGDTLLITLNPNLSPPPTVVSPLNLCQGGTADTMVAHGQNLRWYTNRPGDTGTTIRPTPPIDTAGTYIYYVTQTIRGCTSDRSMITVVVHPPPPPLDVTSNGPLCLHDTLKLSAAFVAGSIYSWSGPNGFTSNLQNPVIPNVGIADSGLYSLVDSLKGCPTQVSTIDVLVDNVFSKILADKRAACVNDTLTLNFGGHIPDTNSTIRWDFAGGTLLSGDPTGQSKGPYIIRWDTLGRKLVTVTAQNWRCVSKVIDTIPVVWAPTVMFDMPKDICIYDTVKATVSDYSMTNADSLTWDFGGGSQVGGGTGGSRADYYVSFGSTGQKVVKLTISYPQCIRQPYTDTVQIRPLPDAQINAISRTNICEGDTVTFTAVLHDQYRYTWAPEKQVSQTSGIGNSEAVITILQTGYIYMSARDKYNCVATDSMDVKADACCAVSFPSAFTPNGDGRNDVFRPITVGNHHVKIFRIVNRYGQTVFQSNIERQGWDGKLNGVPQDMGTYFYFFSYECNGKTIEEKGDVILIR